MKRIMDLKFVIKIIATSIVVLALGLPCTNASANVIIHLDETFQSGATFTGDLTFSDAFDNLLAVDGVLTDNPFGPNPDFLTWPFLQGSGYNSISMGSGIYADWLMDGTPSLYMLFIEIDWRVEGGGNLVLDSSLDSANTGSIANAINYTDPMVSYSFSNVRTVPEPFSVVLLGIGLMGIAGVSRKFQK
jgi:hypothetical protein